MSNLLLLYLIFLSLQLPLPFSSASIARPGCPDRCGSLSLPYPFGVGPNCSFGPSFDISCNNTKPYLTMFPRKAQVMEIKASQIRIEHSYLLTRSCYNTTPSDVWHGVTMNTTQYTLSEENWLTAIGCDDLVVGLEEGNQIYSGSGCVSYCRDPDPGLGFCPDNGNGYSAGIGCCRAPIPTGLTSLGARLSKLDVKWQSRKNFRCSYAFIQEKGIGNQSQFSYPLSYLSDPSAFIYYDEVGAGWKTSFPLVLRLDWRIGAENCSQARRSRASFACRDNSICVDFAANVGGYHCRCLDGYQGNPYLPGGCQDINECNDNRINPCDSNAICTNTPGSVACSCPEGYYGDGKKDGSRCIRVQHSNKLILISTGLGSGFGFILLLTMCLWLNKALHKRKNQMLKDKFFKRNGGLLLQQQTNDDTLRKTKLFSIEELETATDSFNESRILGKGGQGTVYKGMLSDGKIIAVKKSKVIGDNLLEQFINEVVILSQINHRNVVKLLGSCLETDVPLLVYEFLPNGTLFDLIHDRDARSLISWSMRLKIATEIAGALAYIHSASSVPIYHRDIKSQNLLLDEKYVVKLADFGISRSIEVDQTHLTTMVKGTFGYLDPEYFHSHHYSEKSEVYSFGVVLAELLTAKKPIFWESEESQSLATRFVEYAEENRLDEFLDPQILEHGREDEVNAVARLARRCLNCKGKMRPCMKEVTTELESLWISQIPPPNSTKIEQDRGYDANSMIISDMEETWKTGYTSETNRYTIEGI